ncbi:MAG: hypothetical protein J6X57_05045 [Bacteroidales bacterium]|nr:hypothetical protein [Bacteroidales bacterium]
MKKEIIIPKGSTPEVIKARKQIIGDFYAKWNATHPDKQIWNKSLNAYIHVKFQSINETKGHAAISYESTLAVFHLTKILENATIAEKWTPKSKDKNQRPYSRMLLMRWKNYRLIVGFQKSKGEYVQYYVGSI